MPVIPAMSLTNDTVNVEEIYEQLWKGSSSPVNAEVLLGGLDKDNYAGGNNSIKAHQFQIGSFARGWYQGFDRWHFHYARQLDGDGAQPGATPAVDSQRMVHSGLSARFFLPWDAAVLVYGYQGFFQHDATFWQNDDDPPNTEFWELQLRIKNLVDAGLYQRLSTNRESSGPADPTDPGYVDPGPAEEHGWCWVQKQRQLHNVSAGYQQLELTLWGRIISPDPQRAKVITPTGGLWMLALR